MVWTIAAVMLVLWALVMVGSYTTGEFTMRKLAVLVLVAWCFAALSGCNTLRGAGKDIEKAGEGIQKSTY
jgi:predicted small secreted protein